PVWDPENWLPADLNHGPWPSRMVLDMDEGSRAAWIKDVTSNDAKAIRRLDDLLEATYQKYRAELKGGRDISAEARRLQMRKDIEADPDLEVDRNAPKDFVTDQELEKRYPVLAKWMVSRENPLVPRVFVNRVWQWHFGEGIVRSADDFGVQGAKPTHPELLDYLTVSFEEHNWDLKWLTKEIVMSQVYRQASA